MHGSMKCSERTGPPADVLKAYANASIVGDDRVVFNINNRTRLDVFCSCWASSGDMG